ncbi:putative tRNA/rRNA methyltransferase [Flavobacterium longum]|uniref:TrmH family RNA methyltransferase n=1 Tax=Flavobacterium longum TaxID=1299340 RepID=UPI0039E77BE4
MVSKSQIKLITALHQKKYRQQQRRFIAEGVKVIGELLAAGWTLEHLYLTNDDFADVPAPKRTLVSDAELQKMSALTTANTCLAVFHFANEKPVMETGLLVALDDIRDPGNLGTIIRLCDWFGISQLVCSQETAELYNPKVVQATMGSMARVAVNYVNLPEFLQQTKLPVFGTFMDGENIYRRELPASGIIVLGNEANGISTGVEALCSDRIAIPRFGEIQQTESLNVATATAIILSEFRRR